MSIIKSFIHFLFILGHAFLLSEIVSAADLHGVKLKGSPSIEVHTSYINIYRIENRQPHPWLNGFRGGPDIAFKFRWLFPGGFSIFTGYHISSWSDRRLCRDQLCDIYLVCIDILPLSVEKYTDRLLQHGYNLGASWQFPQVCRIFSPVFSVEFRLDRLKYTTSVRCEYISPIEGEQHLFSGSSRMRSAYSPGIGIGIGLEFSMGRFQLIPEFAYTYSPSRVSYLGFDVWHYTHVWLDGNTRYHFHYLQNDRNRQYDDDERFYIEAFEFRMTLRFRLLNGKAPNGH